MTTDYDPIAEQCKRSKLQPWRAHIESFTLMALLGDLSGKTVVDVSRMREVTRRGGWRP